MKKKLIAITAFSSVARREFVLLFLFTMIASFTIAQQKVIQLYKGAAPGSENWNWEENEAINPMNFKVIYNVVKPTLTVFSPDSPNGTAVIVCPAGTYGLNIEHEGINVARELNKKGITAFLLKYRVVRTFTNDQWQEAQKNIRDTSSFQQEKKTQWRNFAFDDLITAMDHVRKNANEYKVAPDKIGIIGFSATAGALSARLSQYEKPESKPNFAALIYPGRVSTDSITATTPPIFIAVAADDSVSASTSIKVYSAWKAARRPAELHIYSKGGHGLRFAPGNTWIHRFGEWVKNEGF